MEENILEQIQSPQDLRSLTLCQLKLLSQQIRDKIVSKEATFAEMAKQYSNDEDTRDFGGEFRWLRKDEMIIPAFREQCEQLKVGDISQPFKSQMGFSILKLDDYKPPHTLNIRDDHAEIEFMLQQKKTIEEFERVIQKLHQETYINIRLD